MGVGYKRANALKKEIHAGTRPWPISLTVCLFLVMHEVKHVMNIYSSVAIGNEFKANMNSDILLQTAAIFFLSNHYLKNSGKTQQTFNHWTVIRTRSSMVACLLRKRKVPGSNPTVDKNLTFCNSRSTHNLHSSIKSMRMKSTITYTQLIPCFRKKVR